MQEERNRRKLDKRGGLIKGQPMRKPNQLATTSGYSRKWFQQKEPRNYFKKMAWSISDNRGAPRRSFLSVEHRKKSSSLRKHQTTQCLVASPTDWCIPADMQEGDYLIVDPACEVNERGTRNKNDGNEVVDDCDLPLDLELTERVEVDDETLP